LYSLDVKALATWEVDSVGNATGIPASMYLLLGNFYDPTFFLYSSPHDK
jgi:hypothetical protein